MIGRKERKILKELDKDSRQSLTQIGKKTRINKETVNYIIKKLEKDGTIKGYFSLINYFKLGFNIFKLLIRYGNVGIKEEKEISKWILKNPEVIWAGETDGKWDLIITIRGQSLEKIYDMLNEFNTKFSKHIQERQLLIAHEVEWLNEKYLYTNEKENYTDPSRQGEEIIEINDKDKKIIEIIEQNARIPTVQIASKLKLTAEAISRRIKNLVKKGIISRFKLRLNHEKLNKIYNHIFISLKDFSKMEQIVSYYENSKNCVFIMKYHGNYDLHLEMITNSQKEFKEITRELREKFGNIISDHQNISIIKEHKLA
ncbi:Lrp/AsnC family transcriptional regulator [archaeon]|jgi:DNA-binding Lrp family transcriptional regulator|nr:Lrp/AsnC family transcriptional regulator [archaeon]